MTTGTAALVLLVGNVRRISDPLATRLAAAGYRVLSADTLSDTWRVIVQESPFAVVIDASAHSALSSLLELCREVAEHSNSLVTLRTR